MAPHAVASFEYVTPAPAPAVMPNNKAGAFCVAMLKVLVLVLYSGSGIAVKPGSHSVPSDDAGFVTAIAAMPPDVTALSNVTVMTSAERAAVALPTHISRKLVPAEFPMYVYCAQFVVCVEEIDATSTSCPRTTPIMMKSPDCPVVNAVVTAVTLPEIVVVGDELSICGIPDVVPPV